MSMTSTQAWRLKAWTCLDLKCVNVLAGEQSFKDDAAEQLSPAAANLLLNPAWTAAAIGEHELSLDLKIFIQSGRSWAQDRCQSAAAYSFEDDAAEQLSPASADLLLNPAWTAAAIREHNLAPKIQYVKPENGSKTVSWAAWGAQL